MSVLARCKSYLFNRKLKRYFRPAHPKATVNPAREICLFMGISGPGDIALLDRFCRWLIDRGREVEVILFADKIPDFAIPERFFLLVRGDLNWYGIPKPSVVDALPELRFDVVMNFDREQVDVLHYLTVISRADLKVGFYSTQEGAFDLLIDTPSQGLERDIMQARETIGQISV